MTGQNVVELRDVFCVHRTNQGDAAALQGTHLELAEGEVLCVLGPSGAGKSTLLRVIAGIQTPSAGSLSVLGCDVGRMRARARARLRHRELGFLGQHAGVVLPPDLPARDAVALPLALRGVGPRNRRPRIRELLRAAGLQDRADALPGELSGGERQRFAACAALAHRPALLLADEPTGELDACGAEAVRALISALAHIDGTSVIIASHDPASATIADRCVRIRDGRVAEEVRDGQSAVVVGPSGWLHLPTPLLQEVGIRGRARVRPGAGGLVLTGASGAADTDRSDAHSPTRAERWRPARVELQSLTRGYRQGRGRRRVIAALSEVVPPGQLTAVTGSSGTGKTTLLKLVVGLDRPDSGELTIDGVGLGGLDGEALAELRRRRIGYLPQEPAPVGFLSAFENIVLVLRIRGWERGEAAQRAALTLERVGLAHRAGQRVHRLSAGEAQRAALARALAGARGLLVVDEPTSRLDEANAATVAGLLAAAAAQDGQTVICAAHDPEVIRRADHVIALRR